MKQSADIKESYFVKFKKACKDANIDVLKDLITNKEFINARDEEDLTPLCFASLAGHSEVVKMLLEAGADHKAQDKDGFSALRVASIVSHSEIVKMLLEAGADHKAQDKDGFSALHSASGKNDNEIVKILLEAKADFNAKSKDGLTPLHFAADNGHSEIVKILLENGANLSDKDNDGWTALHFAAGNGHSEVVKILLEKGANFRDKNKDGWTALHFSARNGHSEVVKILLEKEANFIDKDNDGMTALHFAVQKGHSEIVKILLEAKADFNAKSKDGWTPLHFAAHNGHSEIVKILLENGANLSDKDNNGYTALHFAVQKGHSEIVKILLEKGVDCNIATNKYGFTALHLAAQKGNSEIVKILLENGANLSDKDKDGYTALHFAAQNGHSEVVKILLEAGADLKISTQKGSLPHYLAIIEGHSEVIRVIVAHILNKISKGIEQKAQIVKDFLRDIEKINPDDFHYQTSYVKINKILKEEFVKSLISSDKLLAVTKSQYFPKSLFLTNESSLQKSSPYALFDVVLAVSDDQSAFRSLTLPSQLLCKKNIILDSSLNQFHNDNRKQILEYLVKNDFNVYLCIAKEDKDKLQQNFAEQFFSEKRGQVAKSQQTLNYDFISLNGKSDQEIEEFLESKTLGKFVLSEDSLNKLAKHNPSLASDNISVPDVKQLLTVFGCSFVSSSFDDSDIDCDLFADIDQQGINLIIGVLETEVKEADQIYIAEDSNITIVNDQDSSRKIYRMKSVGEILSGNIKYLKTRTGIFNINNFQLTKLNSNQVNFAKVDIILITNSQIAELKNVTDGAYVKFTIMLQANKKQRLNSIDAQERLVGVLDDIDGLTIEKGDDGFFYATANQDRELSYVLDGRENQTLFGSEEMLPDDNPIKKIIDDYRDPDKGFVASIDSDYVMPKIQDGDISAWKKQVYKERAGSCRHRVVAVYDKIISQHPQQRQNLRITSINNNHMILEARANIKSKWLQFDLGGAEADLVYKKKSGRIKIENKKFFNELGKSNKALNSKNPSTHFCPTCFSCIVRPFNFFLKSFKTSFSSKSNTQISTTQVANFLTVISRTITRKEQQKTSVSFDLSSLSRPIEISSTLTFADQDSTNPAFIPSDSPLTTFTILNHDHLSRLAKETTQELLQAKKQPRQINSLEDLLSSLTVDNLLFKKTLLVTKDHEDIAQMTIKKFSDSNQENKLKIFYLNSPNQAFKSSHLNINQEGEVEIEDGSVFKRFLQTYGNQEGCIIIVDWSSFSNKQILALNTILDQNPSFDGVKITNPSIVSIAQEIPNDPSFLSRHNSCLKINEETDLKSQSAVAEISPESRQSYKSTLSSSANQVDLQTDTDEALVVDLQGFVDWKQKLFGVIDLNEGKIKWQKSEFCKKIAEGHNNFKIINISELAKKEFEQELKIARAIGYYDYFGYKLPVDFKVSFEENELNFTQFFEKNILEKSLDLSLQDQVEDREFKPLTINKKSNATSQDLPSDCLIVNGYSFDFLLKTKKIADGNYYQEEGLIAQHQNKSLNLFLTSKLSDQQYYCLCKEAFEHNVTLNLYLARAIELPALIRANEIPTISSCPALQPLVSDSLSLPEIKPQILVTNDPISALQEIQQRHNDIYAVIDVEDYDYSQLFTKTKFQRERNSFKDFQQIQSEFYQRLCDGKKIILKGQFSQDLLEILHPILAGQDPNIKDNLILIIEDKKISKSQDKPSYLSFLGEDYQLKHFQSVELNATTLELFEDKNDQFETDFDQTSQEKSAEFIKQRKNSLISILQEDCLVQMVGHSGVGKTQLIQRLEEDSNYVIYNEITNFEDWALDESDKIKVLFIDEANIEDSHLTKFSPLKDSDLRNGIKEKVRLLHNGKFYELSKNHKVIFARNPENYSANRNPQKLFDQDVKSLYLRDFPSSYIYEEILKVPIYEKLAPEIKLLIPEQIFKNKCKEVIKSYQAFNLQKRQEKDDVNCKTVRELQEEILVFIHNQTEVEAKAKASTFVQRFEIVEENPSYDDQIISQNFISTTATNEAEKRLRTAIQIRKMQRTNKIGSATGLNGLIIEGSPGIGKSEMIKAVLEAENISQGSIDSDIKTDQVSSATQKFYKIDAGTSLDKMKQIIIKAYEQGNIVWIDEINSCIDNSDLEKILNATLTGKHPEGKKDVEQKPGFMLISSINPPILAGRSQLSPALKHRSTVISSTPLSQYSEEDLEKICQHMLTNSTTTTLTTATQQQDRKEIAKFIAQNFKKELSENSSQSLSLRDLRDIVKTISSKEISITKRRTGLRIIRATV